MAHPMRDSGDQRWLLDPDKLHLNHGSFGATPARVLEAFCRNQRVFESDPTGFIDDRYLARLTEIRLLVAEFVGADPAGLVLVPNATSGVASVLGSLDFGPDDEIIVTDRGYNACRNIIDVTAERTGATVVVARIAFPGASPDQAAEAVLSRVGPATRLVVIDHVTSSTALVLPVERIVSELEPDVPVLVDGAHAPGMLPLDLTDLGASFYTGNLHKWVCTPKGVALLAVGERHRESVRPPVISHGWNTPWDESMLHRLFDWTGTFDPSAWLTVPDAISTMESFHPDGWPGIMHRNHAMALRARDLLCDRLGVEPPAPDEMIGSMAAVPLTGADVDLGRRLRRRGIVATVSEVDGVEGAVLRVSAQLYNHDDDYVHLAEAVLELR